MQRRRFIRVVSALSASSVAMPTFAQADEIVIGQTIPLTGSQSVVGQATSAGAKMYFERYNATATARDPKVRFVVMDDSQKPEVSVENARKLIEGEGAKLLINSVGTANAEALIASGLLKKHQTALLAPTTGAFTLYNVNEVVMLRPSYRAEAERAVNVMTTIGIKDFGLVYQNDPFGTDFVTGLDQALSARKLEVRARASYERQTTEVDRAVDAMLNASQVQVIYLAAVTLPAAEFVKRYRGRGGRARIIGPSIIDAAAVVKVAGLEASRGLALTTIMPITGRSASPLVRNMILDRARSSFSEEMLPVSTRSLEGYLTAQVAVEAIRGARAGVGPSGRVSAVDLLRNLRAIRGKEFGEFRLNFSDTARGGSLYISSAILDGAGQLKE